MTASPIPPSVVHAEQAVLAYARLTGRLHEIGSLRTTAALVADLIDGLHEFARKARLELPQRGQS